MAAAPSPGRRLTRRFTRPDRHASAASSVSGGPRVRRRVVTLSLLVVLLIALLAAVPGLRGVMHQVRSINPVWIAIAITLELASNVSFVVLFRRFFDRLTARDARLLGWTEQGSGALLPGGGAGGLALGGWLMHLTGAPTQWIVRRSGALFWLTSATSGAALIIPGLALIAGAPGPHGIARVLLPTVVVCAITALVLVSPLLARSLHRAPHWLEGTTACVREAENLTLANPSWRLAGALGYLGFDMAVLWVCLRALGHPPGIAALMLAYGLGYVASALPVPGGIGVLDAGLTGALTLYGTSPTHAAAAVLVYHAVALWVPGLGGLLAYLRLRPRLMRAGDPAATSSSDPEPCSRRHTMNTLAALLKPIQHGWAVTLSDDRELARFTGPGARRRAVHYLSSHDLAKEAGNAA